ncbi:MAG: hypothetical protein KKI08_07400 [Armatimonadetes bacterium]|nr:hypothetical protein [Armatimonadota bacterium]
MIQLRGSADDIGRQWGEMNRGDIVAHLEEFLKLARDEHGLDEATLVARSRRHVGIIEQLAPHWLEEAAGIASAAGVALDPYLACLVGRYRGLLFSEDCTSYAAVGSVTADGRPLFHKNRDNRARPQAFYRKETLLPGVLPFISVGDTSDTGAMMMVNAAGLAGSADMAGSDPDPRYTGLMNPYGLRHIAERATTCAEALEIVRMMNERGWYAGGSIATNWAFADATGHAMIVYNAHRKVEVTAETRDGCVQTVEREGLRPLLEQGRLTPTDFNDASRLPGVCVAGNCSSLTVQIDPERPDLFTCAWAALGKADETGYFPLYMGATGTPEAYANGETFAHWQRGVPLGSWQRFEADVEQRRQEIEAEARRLLDTGDEVAARERLSLLAAEAVTTKVV